jgi:hypothetical protein
MSMEKDRRPYLVRMLIRRSSVRRGSRFHFPVMLLGLGRGGCGLARRIAIRIGSGIRSRRIGLNLSPVVAGFRLGSRAGVCSGLLGFLGQHGGSRQKRNKNELFHNKILKFSGPGSAFVLAPLHEETAG